MRSLDLNADGFRDVIAVTSTRAYIRYGAAGGTFGLTGWFSTAGAAYADIDAGDIDADGDLDLAIADPGTGRIIVRRNNGGVNFPVLAQIAVGANPRRVFAAHMNFDTRADIVAFADGANTVSVVLSAVGGFMAPAVYAVGNTDDIALGDCNGDTYLDLMYFNGTGTATTLHARRNTDVGVLSAPLVSPLPLYDAVEGFLDPLAIESGDFDNDGFADAVVSASESRLAPATSDGDCTFTVTYTPLTMTTTWAWSYRLRAFDLDEDGALDLGAPHGDGGAGAQVYSVVFGSGTGTFPTGDIESHPPFTVIPRDLAFGDYSADGVTDILVAADVGVLLERGTR